MQISQENIFTNVYLPNTNEVNVLSIISTAIAEKIDIDEQEIKSGFLAREALGSTAFGDKFAIPHANSSEVHHTHVFVFTFDEGIDWRSEDDELVNVVVALIMPRNDHQEDYHEIIDNLRHDSADSVFLDKIQSSLSNPEILSDLLSKSVATLS